MMPTTGPRRAEYPTSQTKMYPPVDPMRFQGQMTAPRVAAMRPPGGVAWTGGRAEVSRRGVGAQGRRPGRGRVVHQR